MIGKLTGNVLQKSPPFLLLDVNGIGYEIQASMTTFTSLPDEGNDASLFIHMQTREDGSFLYGFYTDQERWVFREIIKVSGIGPKLSLAILSGMNVNEFGQCIIDREVSRLVKLPGVGKKTAERLVVELQDRLDKHMPGGISFSQLLIKTPGACSHQDAYIHEAMSALVALGYKSAQAKTTIDSIFKPELTRDDLIRLALQKLAS